MRKSRLPKDYDASKTPDPERWLPLKDRSTYRLKGRKGRQKAAEKTQGGGVSGEKGGGAEAKAGGGSEGVIKAAEKKPGGGQAKGKKKGKK